MHADWYVTTGNRDIGDFYVSLRDSQNTAHLEYYLPYDTRTIDIAGNLIATDYMDQLQLCVLAKKSAGNLRSLFDSQCVKLPKDFNDIKRRYNSEYNYAYTILSNNVRKSSRRTWNQMKSGSKRITLELLPEVVLFLIVFIQMFI